MVECTRQTETKTTFEPWIRTVSGHIELVTPTVVDGITFSASPRNVKTPTPWVSLKKDGLPKTIKPKVKGLETKNAWPDYEQWFDTPVTVTHDLSNAKGNKEGKTHHKEVKMIPINQDELRLNPLIRCTPDRYFDKNKAGPLCTPQKNSNIVLGKTHWVSWFTRYFDSDEKVRIVMAYVESKGINRKRDTSGSDPVFFESDWLDNDEGFYPLQIEKDWLLGQYNQLVGLGIQPQSVPDDEFDLLANGTILRLRMGPTVQKDRLVDPSSKDDGLIMTIIALPTCVLVFFCFYMCFLYSTRDLRSVGHKSVRRRKKRDGYYEQLDMYEMT